MSNRGRIPDEVIRDVLARTDIKELVGRYVSLTKQGKYLKGLCPFHSEKTPSFTVTPEKQMFHCYGCGKGGTSIKFLMEIENYSFVEAISVLAEELQIPFAAGQAAAPSPQDLEADEIMKAHELVVRLYQYILKHTDAGKPAMEYLRSRGFNERLIDAFQIGYAPSRWDTVVQLLKKHHFDVSLMEKGGLIVRTQDGSGYVDRFRERVMFPLWNGKGQPIAFSGRVVHGGEPKYLNTSESPIFNKSRILYHLHEARPHIRKHGQVVMFEGFVDVIKAWEAGVYHGVATMGTALTEQHLSQLKRLTDRVLLCYDGDSAGQNAAYKSIPMLEKHGFEVVIGLLPTGQDPADYLEAYGSDRFMREVIEQPASAMKFKLIHTAKQFRLQDDEERLRYIRGSIRMIAQLESPVERERYIKELAQQYHYSLDSLKQEMAEVRANQQKIEPARDNIAKPWNNGMNDRGKMERVVPLLPAYHTAERKLLAMMMADRGICLYVSEQLGDQFHVEAHAALAAYLYAFYSQNDRMDIGSFTAMLQNDRLESLAAAVSMLDIEQESEPKVIEDYIREIKKVPQLMEIARLREESLRAERSGDAIRAAQIAVEIITLEQKLKHM